MFYKLQLKFYNYSSWQFVLSANDVLKNEMKQHLPQIEVITGSNTECKAFGNPMLIFYTINVSFISAVTC